MSQQPFGPYYRDLPWPPNVSTAICQPPNVPTAICHTNRHKSWLPFGPTAKRVDRHTHSLHYKGCYLEGLPVKNLPKIRVNLVILPVKGFQIRVAKKHMLNAFGLRANQMEFEDDTDICISLNSKLY